MASLEEGSLYKEAKFKNLKELSVSCRSSLFFSSEMLSFLLSSPELKSLKVYHCDALTDDILEKAALLHEFQNLEILHIFSATTSQRKESTF